MHKSYFTNHIDRSYSLSEGDRETKDLNPSNRTLEINVNCKPYSIEDQV